MSDHTETARVFLRIAAERAAEAPHAQTHLIHLARSYGLPWDDIAHETGLSVSTCRKLRDQHLKERREAAA